MTRMQDRYIDKHVTIALSDCDKFVADREERFKRIAAISDECAEFVKEVREAHAETIEADRRERAIAKAFAQLKPEVDRLRAVDERASRLEGELNEKTEALRRLSRETDPQRQAAALESARQQGRDEAAGTIATLRGDLERTQAEVRDLRASKKKLRERIERLEQGR